jgi:4-amino-4-deoxy-L-arabinose transferase-like glycosyltransferase
MLERASDTLEIGPQARRSDIPASRFAVALLLIALAAIGLRLIYPAADPPAAPSVGIIWHDEGAWVHNARNRALFGAWKLDEWNPMYITPVLTGLEYISFAVLGVGLRQARLVPELLGVLSVLLLGLGVARIANRRAGLIAAALLATNFVYVMYNRAATIEATMVAFLVVAWYGYARVDDSPKWGLLAGIGAILAYFTKASAVFFVAAISLDAVLTWRSANGAPGGTSIRRARRRAALYVFAGLVAGGLLALVLFVLPHWQEYRFYNWQMSVTRKPSYSLRSFVDRASQLPLAADFFTRMWPVLIIGSAAAVGRLSIWRTLVPGERLLPLWIALGVGELIAHDVQERRLLFLVPPLVALGSIALARDRRLVPAAVAGIARPRALLAAPVVLYGCYLAVAALTRVPFIAESQPGEHPAPVVRTAAVVALAFGTALYAAWPRASRWLARQRWTTTMSMLVVGLVLAGDVAQFAQWAAARTYHNYDAMVLVGRMLPPGTLVHGKLANGLALESGIRPVFVGRGFGNYADRARRDDVRYLLTYVSPFLGYEGGRDASGRPIVFDVLHAYPRWRFVRAFPVAESDGGHDAAALVDKMPERK